MIAIDKLKEYQNEGYVRGSDHPHLPLTIWCYTNKTQFEAKWDEITRAARGLVTDDEGNIITRPIPKFFNLEELKDRGDNIPQNLDYRVYKKLDGSMIQIFYYDGRWIVTSKGSFTSDQAIMAAEMLDRQRFPFNRLDKKLTYYCELTGTDNKIVVDYSWTKKLTLWAITDKEGKECPLRKASDAFNIVSSMYMYDKDFDDYKGAIMENEEGYVVKFTNGFRFKVKGEWYIDMHKIITNCTYRDIWQKLKDGADLSEYFENMPEEFTKWAYQKVGELIVKYQRIEYAALKFYDENKDKGWSRKEWALNSLHIKPQAIIFHILDNSDYSDYIWRTIKPEHEKAFEL